MHSINLWYASLCSPRVCQALSWPTYLATCLISLLYASLGSLCACQTLYWLGHPTKCLSANHSLGSWPLLLVECTYYAHMCFHIWIKSKLRHLTHVCFMLTPYVVVPMGCITHHDSNAHACMLGKAYYLPLPLSKAFVLAFG